ncbi:hypothetical protein [Nocardia sp. NPDC056000]|uniref:hypothetical protein n=1 Tax=Nocardia sp. NPDC056000 TaxID=3345674 RepID=UPI0035D6CFCD
MSVGGGMGGGCIVVGGGRGFDRGAGGGAGETAIRGGRWGDQAGTAGRCLFTGDVGVVAGCWMLAGRCLDEVGKPEAGLGLSVGGIGVELEGRDGKVMRRWGIRVFGRNGGEASLWTGQRGRDRCRRVWASGPAAVGG